MQLIQVPGEIYKAEAKRNGVIRLFVESQENIPEETRSRVLANIDKLGYFCFLPELSPIRPEDIVDLPKLEVRPEDYKSPAQRMRAVLYRLWEQGGHKTEFEDFYCAKMDAIIEQLKTKLP